MNFATEILSTALFLLLFLFNLPPTFFLYFFPVTIYEDGKDGRMQRWRWEYEVSRRRVFARRRISRLSYGLSNEADSGTRHVVSMQTMMKICALLFLFTLHFKTGSWYSGNRDYDSPL